MPVLDNRTIYEQMVSNLQENRGIMCQLGKFEAAIESLQKSTELEYDQVFELAKKMIKKTTEGESLFQTIGYFSPDFEGANISMHCLFMQTIAEAALFMAQQA